MIKTFASEEEKNKAIEDFDERSGDLSDLEEIMNAEISSDDSPADKSVEKPEDTPPEPVPSDTTVDDDQPAQSDEDKEKPEETKSDGDEQKTDDSNELEELRATVKQQKEFIESNLSQMDNLRKLEEKVVSLEKAHSEQDDAPKKEVELRSSKLTELKERREKLLQKYKDPEDVVDAEYVKEMNEIQAGLFEELSTLQHNMTVIQQQASDATEKADSYIATREEETINDKIKAEEVRQQKEVNKFTDSHDEFKLSKPWDDVKEDYKQYQRRVSRVYFGRDPQNVDEVRQAMAQLNRRSPDLLNKLKMSGIPDEPNDDMVKYLATCELWDYWQGFRKDPLTGEFRRNDNGSIVQLTRYEPTLDKHVPDTYPSIEAAFNDQSAKNGYYTKKIIAAKIKGGKSAMDAIKQRDGGAKELGANETAAGAVKAVDDAYKSIMNINEEEAMRLAMEGDFNLLNEYNSLAEILKWDKISIA